MSKFQKVIKQRYVVFLSGDEMMDKWPTPTPAPTAKIKSNCKCQKEKKNIPTAVQFQNRNFDDSGINTFFPFSSPFSNFSTNVLPQMFAKGVI